MSEEEIAKLEMDNFVLAEENRKLQKELDNSISKDVIRDKTKEAERNYGSCSKGNVVEKAYYKNKIDTLKELLGG